MITDVNDLLDALGGTSAVADMAGISRPAVSNWRARGLAPAEYYLLFSNALRRKGLRVAPSVFGMFAPGPVMARVR